MKNTVTVRNDTSLNGVPSVKMTCDCGWEEKAYQHMAERIAQQHLRLRHNRGIVHYDGVRIEVRR